MWDALNQEREDAEHLEAFDAEAAVKSYAECDIDGNCDGIYTDANHNPQSAEHGQPIHVEDENGVVTKWHVAIVEYEPVYGAVLDG